jgi:fucose permease
MPVPDCERIRLLSAAAYAGMLVFGVVMALIGAVLPPLAGRLAFDVADIGTLFLVMNGAMLATSLVIGVAMDRFGMKPPLAAGCLLVAAALVIIARAGAFRDLLPAALLLGIGGSALNGSTNTLVADLHDDPERKNAALNVLGIFFGFGALLLPFAVGALLARFSIGVLLVAAALACAAAGVFAASLRFPAAKQAQRMPVAEIPRFVRHPLVLALAFLLFCESGVEFTVGGFVSTYLTREMGTSVSLASMVLAAYWGAIMIARIALSRYAVGVDSFRVLTLSAAGALAGAVVAAAAPGPALVALGIVVIGASLAGIYPAALAIAGTRFRSHSGTVFGILFAIALGGGMSMPWVAGQIAAAIGLRSIFGVVIVAYAVVIVLSRVAHRRSGDQELITDTIGSR